MHYIFYGLSLIMLLLLSYTAICNFLGRPLLTPSYYLLAVPAIIATNPAFIHRNLSRDYQYSATALQISPTLMFFYLILIIVFIFWFINNRSFHFMNTTSNPKEITEHALRNLNISFEKQENGTKLVDYEDTYIQYPVIRRLIFDKYSNISFGKVKDKDLEQQIRAELKKVMVGYKKPRIITALVILYIIIFNYIREGLNIFWG